MFKNVASQKLTVYVFDSTTNLPKTGDAANLTAYVDKDDGGVTVLGDTSATEKDSTNAKGYYIFDLTQGETNADKLLFSGKSSTANMVVLAMPAVVYTTPPNFSAFSLDSSGRVDVIKVAGTSQTAGDLKATLTTLFTTALTESYNADGAAPTVAQALFLIISRLMEFAISGTTLTAKKLDGSTTSSTFTLNDATNPTSITRAS